MNNSSIKLSEHFTLGEMCKTSVKFEKDASAAFLFLLLLGLGGWKMFAGFFYQGG